MKEEIMKALQDATDAIFLEQQAKLHVISGDVEPWLANTFDATLEKLADVMANILEKQPKLKITDIGMGDVSYPADELANDYEVFLALKTIQDHIEKGKKDETQDQLQSI